MVTMAQTYVHLQNSLSSITPVSTTYETFKEQPPSKRRKLKQVTWVKDDLLQQIRLFSAEDAPSMVVNSQQQAQLKEIRKDQRLPDLPPGFHGVGSNRLQAGPGKSSVVPRIPWRTPEKFYLKPDWQVVSGDGSRELLIQREREKSSLEAIYPFAAAIPDSPAEPIEPQQMYDDSLTPLIPLVPVEDDEILELQAGPESTQEQPSSDGTKPSPSVQTASLQGKSNQLSNGEVQIETLQPIAVPDNADPNKTFAERLPAPAPVPILNAALDAAPDVVAAAAAAYAALSATGDIDSELLVSILNNPSMLEALMPKQPTQKSIEQLHSQQTENNHPPHHLNQNLARTSSPLPPEDSSYPPRSVGVNLRDVGISPESIMPPQTSHPQSRPLTPPPLMPPITPSNLEASQSTSIRNWIEIANRATEQPIHPLPFVSHVPHMATGIVRPSGSWAGPPPNQHIPLKGMPPEAGHSGFSGSAADWYAREHSRKHEVERHGSAGSGEGRGRGNRICSFFNSPQGCRKGPNCPFLHKRHPTEGPRQGPIRARGPPGRGVKRAYPGDGR